MFTSLMILMVWVCGTLCIQVNRGFEICHVLLLMIFLLGLLISNWILIGTYKYKLEKNTINALTTFQSYFMCALFYFHFHLPFSFSVSLSLCLCLCLCLCLSLSLSLSLFLSLSISIFISLSLSFSLSLYLKFFFILKLFILINSYVCFTVKFF